MTRLLLALALWFPFVTYSQPYEALGQRAKVENCGGASGTIAAGLE